MPPTAPHDSDFLILGSMLLVPAIVIFIIVTVIRVRKNRFHRQRITKGTSRSHHHHHSHETGEKKSSAGSSANPSAKE